MFLISLKVSRVLLTKCIISSRLVLIHCLFTLFQQSYLFLQQYPFFQFLQSKLDLNFQAATLSFQFTNLCLYFSFIFVLGREQNCLFDPCTEKALILFMLTGNDTNIKFLKSCSSINKHLIIHNQNFHSTMEKQSNKRKE